MFLNSLFFCECIINIFKGGLLGHLTAAAAAGDQTGNLQIRWNWKRIGWVALYLSTVSPCMVATDLRKDLAVAMTPNLTAQEQPWSVYIHQSSRPSAWLTCNHNGVKLHVFQSFCLSFMLLIPFLQHSTWMSGFSFLSLSLCYPVQLA